MELFVIRIIIAGLCLLMLSTALPGGALAARDVPVTIVTDEVFEQLPQWRGIIKSTFRKAREDFDRYAGWNLIIKDWKTFEPGRHDTYASVLEEMAVEIEFQKGVLIYFAGRQYVQENRRGFALLDRRALAVSLDSRRDMAYTLRHELGHVAGLPHCPGKNIMAEVETQRTWEFTTLAKDALAAVRGMAMGNAPLFVGADLTRLQEVHEAWSRAGYGDARIMDRLEACLRGPELPKTQ